MANEELEQVPTEEVVIENQEATVIVNDVLEPIFDNVEVQSEEVIAPSIEPEIINNVVAPVIDNVIPNLDLASIPEEVILTPTVTTYSDLELTVIMDITKADGYSYSETDGLNLINPKNDFPTPEVIMEQTTIKRNEIREQNLYSNLSSMCTILSQSIKQWLSSKYVTPDQQERYEIKAKAAKEGNIAYFVDEASLLGLEPEVLMAAVLEMSTQWQTALEMSAIKIDAIRVYIKLQIEQDIDFAEFAIGYFRDNLATIDLQTPIKETVDLLKSEYEKSKSKE
jgi:hypothetical protein